MISATSLLTFTHLIIAGLILLTLSGIGWLILGYGFSAQLIAKIILVVVIWALGPVIDKVIEQNSGNWLLQRTAPLLRHSAGC